ncbi:MAG: hypothetical protein H6720_29460 [Sandaracinus sp.]|nr:hypothetical protein [Sandaracinus sp.]MCB9623563.1 hypothetical protein [Sandaracinus sp.]
MNRFTSFVVLSALYASAATAQSPSECAPTGEIDALRLLRQTSLDVRGCIPSFEELAEVRDAEDRNVAVDRILGEWLESDEYFAEVRRQHRQTLWGSLEDLDRLRPQAYTVSAQNGIFRSQAQSRRRQFRGRDLTCLDREQTQFDADGRPVPMERISGSDCGNVGYGANTCVREGWVNVRPYWDPSTTIKVCAFDAQDHGRRLDGSACGDLDTDPACGCGADLRYCSSPQAEPIMRDALADEPARLFESIVRADRPYHEAFTAQETLINGPVAHFHRYLSGAPNETTMQTGLVGYDGQMGDVPNVSFDDREWRTVERGEGHAGVLTTPGYLLRFNSHRARANRFHTAFLCDPFVPSAGGIPAEEAEPDPNLRERAGCADCHEVLEPAAAHWARWRINSTFGFFDDASHDMASPLATCRCGGPGERNCSAYCNTYFVTGANSHASTYAEYGGLPLASIYLAPDEMRAIDVGPSALVDEVSEVRQVAACATRTLAERFLGRPVEPSEAQWLEDHVDAFEASGWSYSTLVSAIARDPKYRAIR